MACRVYICFWVITFCRHFVSSQSVSEPSSCNQAMGMESGAIPDSAITASSSYDELVRPPMARVRNEKGGGAWCPLTTSRDLSEYLEIDVGTLSIITSVEVQGRFGNGQGMEYSQNFKLKYQGHSGEWITYRESDGNEVLPGNSNTYIARKVDLQQPITSRRVRFYPFNNNTIVPCLRAELYGCEKPADPVPNDCNEAMGMESGDIPDSAITASSSYAEAVGPAMGRVRIERKGGAWCPKTLSLDLSEYLEIDLGKFSTITSVEVQGRFGNGMGYEYPRNFKLAYQTVSGQWVTYREGDGNEVLEGAENVYLPHKVDLQRPITSRRVRFYPFNNNTVSPCLRVELYGCESTAPSAASTTPVTVRSDIACNGDSISVFVPKNLLPAGQRVTWRDQDCSVSDNGTHYIGSVDFSGCGTTVQFTNDSVQFRNELISHNNNIGNISSIIDFGSSYDTVVPVECVYPKKANTMSSYLPIHERVQFKERRMGHLRLQMQQTADATFHDTLPQQQDGSPRKVPINQNIFIKLSSTAANRSDVGIRVDNCVATPTPSPADSTFQTLVDDGCPAIGAVTRYDSPSDEARFGVRAFQFSASPASLVYVHCQVSVCPTSDPQCITSCTPASRKRRSVQSDHESHLVSSGPYLLVAEQGSAQVATIVAAVCGLLAVVATTFAVIVWKKKRPTENSCST